MKIDLDPDPEPDHVTGFDRRLLIRSAALLGLGGLAASGLARKAFALVPQLPHARANRLLESYCQLSPSQTQGPYWLNLQLLRQDITEGLPGLSLYLFLRVVQKIGAECYPLPGAIVDVWHANAPGQYSGFASQGTAGQTWLRGIQATSQAGDVVFRTIYPGWYPGRATHVHVRVTLSGLPHLTSQLYFPDAFSAQVYQSPPYLAHGQNPTTNMTDGIFDQDMLMGVMPLQGGAYVAGKTIVVA
jgi:protocatechuate 3,4-dioxygenase beta subunit